MTNSPTKLQPGTKRIEFIDAMRGFTIFLVVLHHVTSFCFGIASPAPTLDNYLMQVRMPMFFLISGFVLYREGVVWDVNYLIKFFKKKIPVQLLSPLLFFVAFLYVKDFSLTEGFFHEHKQGYWFTYVLFIYFVIYAGIRFTFKGKVADIIALLAGICLLASDWAGVAKRLPVSDEVLSFLSFSRWQFFLFFVIGTLVKKYYSQVQNWLDCKWVLPMCITIYFIGNVFLELAYSVHVPDNIKALPLTLTGLVVLFSFFRNKQALFSHETRLGRTMQYVGRRTLDIYLLHFFLLPVNLSAVATCFVDYPMLILEFFCSSAISIIIIAMCLLISNIFRMSPFLAHWLFGAKKT